VREAGYSNERIPMVIRIGERSRCRVVLRVVVRELRAELGNRETA
jgi:hypothetical protein